MATDTVTDVNLFAAFRYALGYPDADRLQFLREVTDATPETLEDLQTLYMRLFEAGLPHPQCPLLECHYVANRPAGEVVLENKLFYQHFGLQVDTQAAPDHLLTQLEFLSWIEHCLAAGNPDPESLQRARKDFVARHLAPWIPQAAKLARRAEGGCYADLIESLSEELTRR